MPEREHDKQAAEEQDKQRVEETAGLDDLDIDPEEASSVTGGRLEDPCAGGEVRRG